MDPLFSLEDDEPGDRHQRGAAPSTGESIEAFRTVAEQHPRDADYRFLLGGALCRAGRHAEAVAPLREAVRLVPKEPSYRVALGHALWHIGHAEEAAESWQDGRDLGAHDQATLLALGAALVRSGRPTDGEPLLERVIEAASSEAVGLHGVALWYLGQRDRALDAFQAAVNGCPRSASRQRNLGLALQARGKIDKALTAFREAARIRPGEAAPLLDLAAVLGEEGHETYARAVSIDPALASHPDVRQARKNVLFDKVRGELTSDAGLGRKLATAVAGGLIATSEAAGTGARSTRWAVRRAVAFSWTIVALIVLYVGWALAPPQVDYFLLRDDLAQAARAPIEDDGHVMERVMHAVAERGMTSQVDESNCQIESRLRWRTITCRYQVTRAILPRVVHRRSFTIRVEQPYLVTPRTIFH